jgi:hypothetical protein
MSQFYVIGDRKTGVLLVRTDPVMVARISKATIEAYATSHGTTYDAVFGQIAGGARAVMNKTASVAAMPDIDSSYDAIGKLVSAGSTMSDVDFCFTADVAGTDWSATRWVVAPIGSAISSLNPTGSPEDFVQLRDAPLD